ncbi:hypothetical protein NDU88_000841 [Pleurodeles waltl]|uniref:Uncharacterized protein n=1 Tax=Pleurodeles waltl TaxID=8319 RepID=A0AAV7VYF5_PLEWA|nr:hypothetical protein NDU88_000841 [Pleurodeles waltl]
MPRLGVPRLRRETPALAASAPPESDPEEDNREGRPLKGVWLTHAACKEGEFEGAEKERGERREVVAGGTEDVRAKTQALLTVPQQTNKISHHVADAGTFLPSCPLPRFVWERRGSGVGGERDN